LLYALLAFAVAQRRREIGITRAMPRRLRWGCCGTCRSFSTSWS